MSMKPLIRRIEKLEQVTPVWRMPDLYTEVFPLAKKKLTPTDREAFERNNDPSGALRQRFDDALKEAFLELGSPFAMTMDEIRML